MLRFLNSIQVWAMAKYWPPYVLIQRLSLLQWSMASATYAYIDVVTRQWRDSHGLCDHVADDFQEKHWCVKDPSFSILMGLVFCRMWLFPLNMTQRLETHYLHINFSRINRAFFQVTFQCKVVINRSLCEDACVTKSLIRFFPWLCV